MSPSGSYDFPKDSQPRRLSMYSMSYRQYWRWQSSALGRSEFRRKTVFVREQGQTALPSVIRPRSTRADRHR
ncbi:hypothetical protein A8926_0665 [Saccharopolyspora spinosa]|uniref:Uncharacterized protein n=1 Tax=Saccharopolyspora spinosa TaxID=60894 RepID=A0A2N3XR37_SACSN|nr:hypothetical protein A8926_0665 [Saccharopolyspora spinosa]